jgi:hypothetical protein
MTTMPAPAVRRSFARGASTARAQKRKFWIQLAATGAMIAIVVIVACISASSREIDRAHLKIRAGELRSYASSAALLAEQMHQQKLTRPFWKTQLDHLSESARSAADALHKAKPEPGLEAKLDESRQLADQLSRAVHALAGAGADVEQLQSIQRDLDKVSTHSEALRASLEQPRQ